MNHSFGDKSAIRLQYRPFNFKFAEDILVKADPHITNSLSIADKQLQYVYRFGDLRLSPTHGNKEAPENTSAPNKTEYVDVFHEYQEYTLRAPDQWSLTEKVSNF